MINRYSCAVTQDKFTQAFPNVKRGLSLNKSYNINPLQESSIIIKHDEYEMRQAVWGLHPHFAKDSLNKGNLYNAAVEGLVSKASYRIPIRQSRCIIPADSYYMKHNGAWYRAMKRDRGPIAIAGLYDVISFESTQYISYSMVTVRPNRDLISLGKCMPAIIKDELMDAWLDKDTTLSSVLDMIQVSENYQWIYYQVSDKLSNQHHNTPDLHDEIKSERTLFDMV